MIRIAPRPAIAAAAILLATFGAHAQGPVSVMIQGPPDFYTCEPQIPFPPNTPPGIPPALNAKIQAQCGGPPASGAFPTFLIADNTGQIPAPNRVLQVVEVTYIRYRFNNNTQKCDRRTPMAFVIPEYFTASGNTRATDRHYKAECCEERTFEKVRVSTAIMPLPANGVRPPVPGFGGIGRPYTTAPQQAAVINSTKTNATAKWMTKYWQDTCHSPPKTPSAKTHHFWFRLKYPGRRGSTVYTSPQ